MKLSTTVDIISLEQPISLQEPIALLGSCFSDNIGGLLQQHKFNALVNPFGTIFNPVSIAILVEWALGEASLNEELFVEQDGVYKHFFFHSSHYNTSREGFIAQLEGLRNRVGERLKQTKHLILTLGTAWVYEHLASGKVVANCHKVPSKNFGKRLLSTEEVEVALAKIKQLLPQAQLIVTVSPVRHIKDTLPLNTVSKSALRLAIHQLQQKHPGIAYFPAYELMMDELRDYRFYAADMIHPSDLAVQYIWEKFMEAYLGKEARAFVKQWAGIQKSLNHRPLVPYTASHKQFLEKLREQLLAIEVVDVCAELERLEADLAHCPRLRSGNG